MPAGAHGMLRKCSLGGARAQVAAAQAGPLVADRVMTWRNGSLGLVKNEANELYRRRRLVGGWVGGWEARVVAACG